MGIYLIITHPHILKKITKAEAKKNQVLSHRWSFYDYHPQRELEDPFTEGKRKEKKDICLFLRVTKKKLYLLYC